MRPFNHQLQKSHPFKPRWFLPLLIGLPVPLSILAIEFNSQAQTPKAALITSMSGSGARFEKPGYTSPAAAWITQLRLYTENLFVPRATPATNTSAILKGISTPAGAQYRSSHLIGPTAVIKSESEDVRYRFPCTYSGGSGGLIGWRASQEQNDRGCVPPGVRIRSARKGRTAQLPLSAPSVAQGTKSLLQAQRSLPDLLLGQVRVQYCSAIGDEGIGWGVSSSDSFGLLGAGDPCQRALADCLQTSSGSDCSVVSTWEWQASDKDLIVSLECDQVRKFHGRGTGWAVASTVLLKLKQTAKAIGAKSCVFDVYAAGDVIVAPRTEQLTLFQVRQQGSRLTIDALRGSLVVKSAENPAGQSVPEGSSYLSGSYDGDRYFPNPRSIQRTNLTQVARSPVVQSFLDMSPSDASDADLPSDVIQQINTETQEFQEALRQTLNVGPD